MISKTTHPNYEPCPGPRSEHISALRLMHYCPYCDLHAVVQPQHIVEYRLDDATGQLRAQ